MSSPSLLEFGVLAVAAVLAFGASEVCLGYCN